MKHFLKNWLRKNWKSVLGFCASVIIWILVKENVLNLSYPGWGYLFFGAIEFNGVDEYIEITDIVLTGTFTIGVWIKFASIDATAQIVFGGERTTPAYGMAIDNTLIYFRPTGLAENFAHNGISLGVWTHFTITRNSSNLVTFYQDGVSLGTKTKSGTLTIKTLGAYSNGDLGIDGEAEDFFVHNTDLDSDQVLTLYKSKLRDVPLGFTPSRYWRVDEGDDGSDATGDDVVDASANSTPGIMTNGGIWRAGENLTYGNGAIPILFTDISSPSSSPSVSPSVSPSSSPSISPSVSPSASPSVSPSVSPSLSPSASPSPSISPSSSPSVSPSASPSVSASPSLSPSVSPSLSPSASPSTPPSFIENLFRNKIKNITNYGMVKNKTDYGMIENETDYGQIKCIG
jgi:hypothetical protein